MQDRYAGDVGDSLKFGLLRHLLGQTGSESPVQLGIVWYRTTDESHNAEGKHIAYPIQGHPAAELLRPMDPDLHRRLASVVRGPERSIRALEQAAVAGPNATFFNDLLDLSDLSVTDRVSRVARRSSWLERAVATTAGCDLIFIDTDNGIRTSAHRVPRHRTKAVKHADLDELTPFATRGQSIVAYHHADRSALVDVQAQRRLVELGNEVPVEPFAAVRASLGTTRLFLVGAADRHRALLSERLTALEAAPWRNELRVIWAE